MAVFSLGFLLFTAMVKVAIAVLNGSFTWQTDVRGRIDITPPRDATGETT